MKKNILKVLSLMLALLAISATFFACNITDDGDGATDAVTDVQGVNDPVPRLDWGGRPFRVLTTNNAVQPNFEVVGEVGADRLSQAVYERNIAVQEYCNAEIIDVSGDNDDNFEAIENDFMAGTKNYDLVFLLRNEMSSAIQRGFMKDLTKVEYINLENEWYNPITIESMKVSDRLYHMSSSFSLTDKARTATLYINRDMATELNLGVDVVEEVRAGTWTIEKMQQMVTKVAESGDTNNDGKVQNTDNFGIAGGGEECVTAFYTALGNSFVDLEAANGDFGAKIIDDRSLNGLDAIKAMFDVHSWAGFTGGEAKLWKKNENLPADSFIHERTLFYSGTMSVLDDFAANADFAYTAITFPKYDTDQDRYYTTNDNHFTSTFAIPYMAHDVNFSGYMIEVLSWTSHTTTYPEYYQVKCLVQKSYDPVCAEMLQLNYEGLVFDFGLIFSNTVKYKAAIVKYTTQSSNTKGMTTLYAETKGPDNLAIQGIIDAIEDLPE